MPFASALSRLGVAKNTMVSYSVNALTAAGTSLTVANSGSATSTAVILIADGANSEVVTASALAANVFTISALTKNHPAGVMVSSIGTTANPTDSIPFTGLTPFDDIKWLDDTGVRGSRVASYDQVAGPRFGQFEFAGQAFADSIGWPLFSLLSDVTYTAGSPSIFAGSTKNTGNGQPSALEYIDWNSNNQRVYSGVVHDSLSLTFNADGEIKYTTKASGFVSGVNTSAPTNSYGALEIAPAWGITSTIGGSNNILVQDGTLDIKAKSVDPINTLDGSQDPYAFFQDVIEASGKMTFVYEDDAQLVNYLTNAKPSLDFNFLRGTGAAQERMQFHMSKVGWRVGKTVRSKSFTEVEVDYTAHGNVTDAGATGGYSAIKATLNNSLTNTGRYQ